eukprot:UN00751
MGCLCLVFMIYFSCFLVSRCCYEFCESFKSSFILTSRKPQFDSSFAKSFPPAFVHIIKFSSFFALDPDKGFGNRVCGIYPQSKVFTFTSVSKTIRFNLGIKECIEKRCMHLIQHVLPSLKHLAKLES